MFPIGTLIAFGTGSVSGQDYPNRPSQHLAAELFKAMAGVNIVRIPYKGSAPAITDLLSGEVQMMINDAGSVAQHVKSGPLRVLPVTSAEPSTLTPGLPYR